jgi:hypothetical protein
MSEQKFYTNSSQSPGTIPTGRRERGGEGVIAALADREGDGLGIVGTAQAERALQQRSGPWALVREDERRIY